MADGKGEGSLTADVEQRVAGIEAGLLAVEHCKKRQCVGFHRMTGRCTYAHSAAKADTQPSMH